MPLKVKGELAAWGGLMGYLSVEKADTYNQIPTFGKLPREGVIALAGHFLGRKHKHIDRAAAAAAAIAGFKLGEQGFKISGYDDDGYDDE